MNAIDDCIASWARSNSTTIHNLKTWPGPFNDVLSGHKRYEIRKNDRGFKVGDELLLEEWVPDIPAMAYTKNAGDYTGREIRAIILHITEGGRFGMPADMCVLGMCAIEEVE